MHLTIRRSGQLIEVTQDGGFSVESKLILRSVNYRAVCKDGMHWYFPEDPGTLVGLSKAVDLLGALATWLDGVDDAVTKITTRLHEETALRRIIQRYMDDRTLPLAGYTTRTDIIPWRHQQVAYHWAMRVPSLYIAHKPGLGKTRTGADIIRGKILAGQVRQPEVMELPARRSEVFPDRWLMPRQSTQGGVLVVCPRVVQGTWYDELLNWQNIQPMIVSYGGGREAKARRAGQPYWVHICSYGSLESVEDNIYDGILADEAHYLANEDSKCSQRMQYLRDTATWAIAMSGTPVSNMYPSLWAQYYWLDRGITLGSSMAEYKRKYFTGTNRKMEAKEGAGDAIAKQISRVTYFQTMQQAFPEKIAPIVQTVRVSMTAEQQRYYEELRVATLADVHAGTINLESAIKKLTKLSQVVQGFVITDEGQEVFFSSAKMDALTEMLHPQRGDFSDRRLLIWTNFRPELARIAQALERQGIPALQLHGDIAHPEQVRDAWNQDYRWRVMVGMIQMGIGINLNAPTCVNDRGEPDRCSRAVFFGYPWKVTQVEQSQDRINRGNQVETCLFRYLVTEPYTVIEDGHDVEIQPMDLRIFNALQFKLTQAKELSEESVGYIRYLLGDGAQP